MMEVMKRYRCSKCGDVVVMGGEEITLLCMEPFSGDETSAVCHGEYIEEPWIDYEEWKRLYKDGRV